MWDIYIALTVFYFAVVLLFFITWVISGAKNDG